MKINLGQLGELREYREYLRRIDPMRVLEYYDAQNCFEQKQGDGSVEVRHSCLIDRVDPHHSHGDQNPSASLNIDKKLYTCWTYGGGGDVLWLIMMLEEAESLTEIIPVLRQFLKESTETKEDFQKELEGFFQVEKYEEDPLPKYSERLLDRWSFTHPYLTEVRGMSAEACSRLRVGWDEESNRITFPVFFRGDLVGWQKRAIPKGPYWPGTREQVPKYKNTKDFPKSKVLYNYDRVSGRREVVVVESPMSVLKAESLTDGEDILSSVVATFGAKVTEPQLDLLRGFSRVYVYMDDDTAGVRAARKISRYLYRFVDCRIVKPSQGMDLGDHTSREEVIEKIRSATPAFLGMDSYGN